MQPLSLIIHNVRSTHNVGSLFRSADGAGVSKVFLTGYTPAPVDRFGREVKEISKTALGAEKVLPWEQREIQELILEFKNEGFHVVALEQDAAAVPYTALRPEKPVALIVGNEVEGIEKEVLEKVDTIIEIPLHGEKESLNVSVAGGIALFEIRNQLNNSRYQ